MNDQAFGIVPVLQRHDDYCFLILQHNAGHWGFPKGHAESKEAPLETACREFEEETGIIHYDAIHQPFVEQYHFTKHGKTIHKTVTYFPAFVYSEQVIHQVEEIKDFAWLGYQDALKTITFAPSKHILFLVNQYLMDTSDRGLFSAPLGGGDADH